MVRVPTKLYLDTARLGLMSPSAQPLQIDFVRFAGEEGSSLYWDRFLRGGTCDWPTGLKNRFPALDAWHGITHLKNCLKQFAGASPDSQILLASRSAQLMKLAAQFLTRHCQNVLVTDLTWPSYGNILRLRQRESGLALTRVSVRQRVLRDRMGPEELMRLLVSRYVERRCDGLFLPAVDNLGIRLPVSEIVRAIRLQAPVRFVVVDGAQALGHVPLRETLAVCDFLIAGCHKWLCASLPMGLGFFGTRRATERVTETYDEMLATGTLDDPLLCFSAELEGKPASRFGETVNVSPLFSCQGAVNDALRDSDRLTNGNVVQTENAKVLIGLLDSRRWRPVLPHASFRSGIVLIRRKSSCPQALSGDSVRQWLHGRKISATAYDGGLVRLSMPKRRWTDGEMDLLRSTFGPQEQPIRKKAQLSSQSLFVRESPT